DVEFEYLVAPLVYDLTLNIEGGDYEIREVYGSPEANDATGDIIKVSTLFPSPTTDGESRGGVIVAHLKKVKNTGDPMFVTASYEDRSGEKHESVEEVEWKDVKRQNASQNVRKAVLLARYANLMQNWIIDENMRLGPHEKTIYVPINPIIFYTDGLIVPRERHVPNRDITYMPVELSYWERLSRPLIVSKDYKEMFEKFLIYMKEESRGIDELMEEEVEILENLTNSPDSM
ncbi:MAG: hypothetical protein KAS07_01385, partial [Candidatus Pacebacteria bacterium]|nr:hypothetical protein [Candidatus Paceibacterota bacterium]